MPKQQKQQQRAQAETLTLFEREARKKGYSRIAGLDEAGRGPLAGPVVAAACMFLDEKLFFEGINDSKLLSRAERERLFGQIIAHPKVLWAYSSVEPVVIDEINIYQATRLAMKEAVEKLPLEPDCLLIDALTIDRAVHQEKIIKGDQRSQSIAAASIIAKVKRDEMMVAWHQKYPNYGFDQHKGYATELHRARLEAYGPSPIHRKSFAPCQDLETGSPKV